MSKRLVERQSTSREMIPETRSREEPRRDQWLRRSRAEQMRAAAERTQPMAGKIAEATEAAAAGVRQWRVVHAEATTARDGGLDLADHDVTRSAAAATNSACAHSSAMRTPEEYTADRRWRASRRSAASGERGDSRSRMTDRAATVVAVTTTATVVVATLRRRCGCGDLGVWERRNGFAGRRMRANGALAPHADRARTTTATVVAADLRRRCGGGDLGVSDRRNGFARDEDEIPATDQNLSLIKRHNVELEFVSSMTDQMNKLSFLTIYS
ncbi:hypothetical protein Scep_021475 [Stephania cephalantha]|uniref:Uncharacterized protein n=1 Tax=Stephania cephalantha TaxID=152367 RepID=A0AAP0F3I2_9MAGN